MPMVSVDVETMPTIHSEGCEMQIFYSGAVCYRFSANIWQMFTRTAEPYDYFPEGIHVEQLDSLFQTIGDIVADTAYHFTNTKIWHAIGNVVAKNTEGRTFETSELFLDDKVPPNTLNAIYTNKKVKVIDPDGSSYYGIGFTADRELLNVRFYKFGAELYVEDSTDTIQQQPAQRQPIQQQPIQQQSVQQQSVQQQTVKSVSAEIQ